MWISTFLVLVYSTIYHFPYISVILWSLLLAYFRRRKFKKVLHLNKKRRGERLCGKTREMWCVSCAKSWLLSASSVTDSYLVSQWRRRKHCQCVLCAPLWWYKSKNSSVLVKSPSGYLKCLKIQQAFITYICRIVQYNPFEPEHCVFTVLWRHSHLRSGASKKGPSPYLV